MPRHEGCHATWIVARLSLRPTSGITTPWRGRLRSRAENQQHKVIHACELFAFDAGVMMSRTCVDASWKDFFNIATSGDSDPYFIMAGTVAI
jgi:hypothetical protein